ncbi:purine-binding chemotaxis protein CheW [Oxalobacteraceae bacterium GrIS 1.11]
MGALQNMLVWTLDTRSYALPLTSIERVLPAVASSALPDAPDSVLGLVDVHGRLVPVFDMRRRFLLPPRETALSDLLVLARANRRPVAFYADSVRTAPVGAIEAVAEHLTAGRAFVTGVAQTPDGMIVIHDLERFLTLDDDACLRLALSLAA